MIKIRSSVLLIFAMLLGLLIAPLSALAKGSSLPPDKVRITGPGLDTPIEITNPQLLDVFAFRGFDDPSHWIGEPDHPGMGYLVMRYLENGSKYRPYDKIMYYPQTFGQRGYVVFVGLPSPESWTPMYGKWYRASSEEDNQLKAVLEEIISSEGLNVMLLEEFEPFSSQFISSRCGMQDCLRLAP